LIKALHRIKANKTYYEKGEIIEFDEKVEQNLVECGAAEYVEIPKPRNCVENEIINEKEDLKEINTTETDVGEFEVDDSTETDVEEVEVDDLTEEVEVDDLTETNEDLSINFDTDEYIKSSKDSKKKK